MLRRLHRTLLAWPLAALLLVTLLLVTLAYQFDAAHTVDVGGYYDYVYVQGFYEREPGPGQQSPPGQEDFRWSTATATVLFPGVGVRGYLLSLRLHGWRPEGLPAPEVRVSVNDHYLGRAVAGLPSAQRYFFQYLFWVPPQAMAGGTARVRLESDAFVPAEVSGYTDTRSLGVAVSEVGLLPLGRVGFSPGWPAWDQLGLALLFVVLLYLGLAAVGLRPCWAALAAALAVLPLAWGLAFHRLWTTIFTARLPIVAGIGLFGVLLFSRLFRRVLAWGRVEVAEKGVRLLLAIFLVGFLIKAGGLLYPYSVAVDLRLQLHWASWIWDGRLAELYGTESPLPLLTMPEEWGQGQDKPLIPYSPYWHITAASFFLLPWRPYDTANVLSVLMDTTKPFLIYFIARRLGLGRRTGMWAALLFALFPANFLMLSWGNAPTMTGLWWTLAATSYLAGAWERLNRPLTWLGLVSFLLGAMLYYTVYALFMGIFMLILLGGMALPLRAALLPPASEGARGGRSEGRATSYISPLGAAALALVAAIGLALVLYYGQFIAPIITRTIPRLIELVRQGGAGLAKVPVTWPQYALNYVTRLGGLRYGLLWPILLAVGSLVTGWKHAGQSQERQRLRRSLLGAWLGTALLFFLVGFRVDMVEKEIWFAMPAIALCAAVTLEWLWRQWRTGRAVVLITTAYLGSAALFFWINRLATYRQEWFAWDASIVGEHVVRLVAGVWRTILGL